METITGISAPPIGIIIKTPSNSATATIAQNRNADCVMQSSTIMATKPRPSNAFSICWPLNTTGLPVMKPCSLPQAMMEPVKVIAPIATPRLISIRLPTWILPCSPMP